MISLGASTIIVAQASLAFILRMVDMLTFKQTVNIFVGGMCCSLIIVLLFCGRV